MAHGIIVSPIVVSPMLSRSPFPVRSELTILPADAPGRKIGWRVKEKVGVAVVNTGLSRLGLETERMMVKAQLEDSGWELVADIWGDRVEVRLESAQLNRRFPLKRIFRGEDGYWEGDYGRDGMLNNDVRRAWLQGPGHLDLHVRQKIDEILDPREGALLPSERGLLCRQASAIPPRSWDGWRAFVEDLFDAVEVAWVMDR